MAAADRRAVGARIAEARAARGLTVHGLACAVGFGLRAAQIVRWEAGRSRPPSTLMGLLASALGVPREWLSEGIGPSPFVRPPQDPRASGSFAYRLTTARVGAGLTLAALAAAARVPIGRLRAWEWGDGAAEAAELVALAAALGVDPEWLGGARPPGGPGTWVAPAQRGH
ncbi:hypothetical protein GCM10010964_18590 [Caldovatus sediminis]|uniref:HTH cro/C1-type domain-containing protein n=1 Tax=Caldovatus sediminis TaxID=2041189 RepID=A0A8J2ZAD8_9PROT|nr:helix-turn-helix transcriptional regulator [Caldovatus sediminis]GGG30935.1 hypothetical protein GCM10010964_18590 [Caldovatus sediminis]